MNVTPSDPRGPRLTRPHEILDPQGAYSDCGRAGAGRTTGGTAAATGLVLGLLALVVLWLDWAYTHTGGEAAALAALIAAAGVLFVLLGVRFARASGRRLSGPLGALVPPAAALVIALVQLAGV